MGEGIKPHPEPGAIMGVALASSSLQWSDAGVSPLPNVYSVAGEPSVWTSTTTSRTTSGER